MSEWRETTIGELVASGKARLQTGPFGSQLHAHDYVTSGTPVIPTEAIGRRILKEEGLPQVSDATVNRLARHVVRDGDILFARRGVQATGLSALVRERHVGWLCGTGAILLRVDARQVDPEFLSFALADRRAIDWLKAHAVGAVMPNLNADVIGRLPLSLPPFREQRRIAEVLGALDDKIELNSRMSVTLEDLTRGLFSRAFMQPGAADWPVRPIGSCVEVVGGSTPSTTAPEFWENGEHAWATPKDLSRLSTPVLLDTERRITDAGLRCISSGLLAPGTVLLSSRAPIGYLAINEVPVAVNQGFIGIICTPSLPNLFLLRWLEFNQAAIVARANGSTFLEISKASFREIPISVPPQETVDQFLAAAKPMHARLVSLQRESLHLSALRDALLPRLLGGELHFSDVERDVSLAI